MARQDSTPPETIGLIEVAPGLVVYEGRLYNAELFEPKGTPLSDVHPGECVTQMSAPQFFASKQAEYTRKGVAPSKERAPLETIDEEAAVTLTSAGARALASVRLHPRAPEPAPEPEPSEPAPRYATIYQALENTACPANEDFGACTGHKCPLFRRRKAEPGEFAPFAHYGYAGDVNVYCLWGGKCAELALVERMPKEAFQMCHPLRDSEKGADHADA